MTDTAHMGDGELSLFVLGTTLLRSRWRIARWTLAGALLALLTVATKPALYRAFASFAPQGNDQNRSAGLASLAGQFGLTLPTASQQLSPEYYARLLRSRSLLRRIAADTFTVAELGGRRVTFVDLFEIEYADPQRREDEAVRQLGQLVTASVVKTTGVVELSAATKWRSVSLAIVDGLLSGVNDFNQRSRQAQAAGERKFVEGRLAVADGELRSAEDRLEQFLRGNRQYTGSAELALQRDRLQRDVTRRQEVYTTLAQSYEDVRLREVRDTPVITVIESPSAPALAEPRGRTKVVLLGIMLGGFIGAMLVLWSDMMARRRAAGDTEAGEFVGAVQALKSDLGRPFRRLAGRR